MRLLLDEDSQGKLLVRLLRDAGHDVQTVGEVELTAHIDPEVFAHACGEGRVLLTRNGKDFQPLHEAHDGHPGILVEYQDRDPNKNISAADLVRAIGNIEASGWDLTGQFVALNAWSY
ncbi:MAG TPA: DUF5615 family PIN-like protein [Chthonomonadaceae bacterium]|nr:DUF5615 family PIN-like protein [Chthonomonadaceae bacterium]